MKKFLIAEAEKARILGMHYNAMGKNLVNEQYMPDNMWSSYVESTNKAKPGARLIKQAPELLSNESINKYKTYDVPFFVNDSSGGSKQVQYQCIDAEPGVDVTFKAGQIFDSNQNLTNIAAELDATGIPWRQMFSWACKPAMSVLAARKANQQPQAQVAGATTAKVGVSPEKQKQINAAIQSGKMTKKVDPTTGKTTYYSTGKGAFTVGMMNINVKNGEDITRMIVD